MTDFTIDISNEIATVEVEIVSSQTFYNIEAINLSSNNEVSVSSFDSPNILEIISEQNDTIAISSDFTASIVFAKDIIDLDNYLANFIDSYNIDCGTP